MTSASPSILVRLVAVLLVAPYAVLAPALPALPAIASLYVPSLHEVDWVTVVLCTLLLLLQGGCALVVALRPPVGGTAIGGSMGGVMGLWMGWAFVGAWSNYAVVSMWAPEAALLASLVVWTRFACLALGALTIAAVAFRSRILGGLFLLGTPVMQGTWLVSSVICTKTMWGVYLVLDIEMLALLAFHLAWLIALPGFALALFSGPRQ